MRLDQPDRVVILFLIDKARRKLRELWKAAQCRAGRTMNVDRADQPRESDQKGELARDARICGPQFKIAAHAAESGRASRRIEIEQFERQYRDTGGDRQDQLRSPGHGEPDPLHGAEHRIERRKKCEDREKTVERQMLHPILSGPAK